MEANNKNNNPSTSQEGRTHEIVPYHLTPLHDILHSVGYLS